MDIKISMQTARKALVAIDIRIDELKLNLSENPFLKEVIVDYTRAKYEIIYAMENDVKKVEKQ